MSACVVAAQTVFVQAVPRAKFQAKWQNDVGGGHPEPEPISNAASSWTTFLKMSAAACLALVCLACVVAILFGLQGHVVGC